jgi:glycosyltransferase involved in cell wall biosynthesis
MASASLAAAPPGARVLRVITRLNIGGPAQHVILLTAALRRIGWETALITGRVDPDEGDMGDLAGRVGVEPVVIDSMRNGAGPLADLRTLLSLYRLFRRERPALVHLHLLKARLLGGLAARWAGVPVVVETFHGTLLAGYYSAPMTRMLAWLERWLARRMDAVVAVSPAVARELAAARIASDARVHVIPLGLDLERLRAGAARPTLRRTLGLGADAPLVGTVGRLVPIKGMDAFIDAAAQIRRSLPAAHFVIVGDGALRAGLERRARDGGLGGQVHFLGWRRDLEELYPDLDLIMLTSLNEGTPVSIIEAMAAGRAVVATRVGGVLDVVEEGVTGVLAPPRDPGALAAAAVALLADPERRRRMGEAARSAVSSRFSVAGLAEQMDTLYRGLLAGRGQRS